MIEYTTSQKRKYLALVLRMNPVQQSDQIIKLRNRMLGKQSTESDLLVDQAKLTKLRERVSGQIDEIRNQMWRQQPDRLMEMLNTIDASQLPEMKNTIVRLHSVIQNHAGIQQLSQHSSQNINLTNTFKRVIMLPPKEAGGLKESYLRQIVVSPELKKIKRSVNSLQREFPQLYAMEADWLGQIQTMTGRRGSVSSGGGGSDFELPIPGWLIWIAFVIIFRVIAAVMRNQ